MEFKNLNRVLDDAGVENSLRKVGIESGVKFVQIIEDLGLTLITGKGKRFSIEKGEPFIEAVDINGVVYFRLVTSDESHPEKIAVIKLNHKSSVWFNWFLDFRQGLILTFNN